MEQFDSEFFQRGFAGLSGIRLFAPPVVTHESLAGELVETRAAWSFQVLDCPADQETCAGDKHYELPIMSMAYQLIDASGQTLNDKTIRFRPWPDKIIVSPALPSSSGAEGNFADYFPAGAYPDMLPVKKPSNGGALNPINIGAPDGAPATTNLPFTFNDAVSVSPGVTLFGGLPRADLQVFLQALAENQYLRILAEPNLIALNGEEAEFLAGGEFPIPVVQGTSSGNGTSISIEYREFGVRLRFRPDRKSVV